MTLQHTQQYTAQVAQIMATRNKPSDLTEEQMAAIAKTVAFLRSAMAATGGAHLLITEMHVSPGRVYGAISLQIRIDDNGKNA